MSAVTSLTLSPVERTHYYYSRLNEDQKKIYRALLSGILSFSKSVKMPMRPMNEITLIFTAVLDDNPAIFYSSSFRVLSDVYKNKRVVQFDYQYPREVIVESAIRVKECLRAFDVVKDKSDEEKEAYVHDYCLDHFSYDLSMGSDCHSVLGIVLHSSAVCEGIAKFVKLALDYLGLRSLVVSGKAKNPLYGDRMEGHSWNIVKIDGKSYHLDVTFDITIKDKFNRYDYFNLPDEDIKKDHVIINDVPKCATVGYDYYTRNGLTAHGWRDFETLITQNLKAGKKTFTLRLADMPPTKDVADKVLRMAQQQYQSTNGSGVMIEVGYNPTQLVFELNFK
jgi:hypothetical protein